MERVVFALTDNTFNDVLTPPSGHKYEVLNLACAQYLGPATTFYAAENLGGGAYIYVDQTAVAAGVLVTNRSYQSLLIPHGSKFSVSTIVAGSSFTIATVTYMDVDTT